VLSRAIRTDSAIRYPRMNVAAVIASKTAARLMCVILISTL
jgi:hypothetical protein